MTACQQSNLNVRIATWGERELCLVSNTVCYCFNSSNAAGQVPIQLVIQPVRTAGWGNQELQCYTNHANEARVEPTSGGDGVLNIEASYNAAGSACDNGPNRRAGWTQVRAGRRAASAACQKHRCSGLRDRTEVFPMCKCNACFFRRGTRGEIVQL